jgi:hypothetical protein
MKKQHKAAISFALALIFALVSLPASALPRFAANAEVTPAWTVPNGYNVHDYTKCVEFLEQTDANGVKNGEKLSENYDPNDPETWGTNHFSWTSVNDEQRVHEIRIDDCNLCGCLDVSGCNALEHIDCDSNSLTGVDVSNCTALVRLYCAYNGITELDVTGCSALYMFYGTYNEISELNLTDCTALEVLYCYNNSLAELELSQNTALREIWCYDNNLTELDVSQNTALEMLVCSNNSLTALDVSQNTALEYLSCYDNNLTELDITQNAAIWYLSCDGNRLTELDLSNNPRLAYDHIRAEGNGFIGYYYYKDNSGYYGVFYAYPMNGASFEGFFDESGALISEGTWYDWDEAYHYYFEGSHSGNVIARFSGGEALPGDVDGNGSVSVADAITVLRIVLGLSDENGVNTDAADMDGNGSITIIDALIILRTAM